MDTNITEIVNEAIKKFFPIYFDEDEYKEFLQDCNPYPYLTSSNGICTLVKKETKDSIICFIQPIATYIKVKNLLHNLDTEAITLVLEIDNGVKKIEKEFPRTILTKMEIKALLPYGVKFLENHSEALIKYLVMTESKAETLHIHTSLGWSRFENTTVFKCSEFLYPSNSIKKFKSAYRGTLDLQPRGKLKDWLEMVKAEVVGNIPLTVCALLGFASPLLAYVTDQFGLGSIIFTIANESSKGKTTSAMLATSLFSNPKLNCGTMRSFNSTSNNLITFLSKVSGFPVALDEATEFSGDFQKLLYNLASGVEKGRLDGNSEMKPEKSWKSIILTTSEFELISQETGANGLKARCFPILGELTKTASSADRIQSTVTSNFGIAGNEYVQWLLDNKENNIIDDYISMKKVLIEESSKVHEPSSLTHRILSKLAVVLLAAHYALECFDLNIDIKDVQDYLINMERNISTKTDFAQNALEIILQEISKNSSKFLTPDRTCGQNIVGKITEQENFKTIAILKAEFQVYCKKNNIQNPNKVLTNLKQSGILQCESDRLTRRIRLEEDLPVQPCYVFQISDTMVTRSNHLSQSIRNFPKGSSEGEINF